MNAQQVQKLVEAQIGGELATTNHHGIDLRRALVQPQRIKVIDRMVRNRKFRDRLVEVWIVLIEKPESGSGYRIVLKDDEPVFGLAVDGYPSDSYPVFCGWYGDFMSAFLGM